MGGGIIATLLTTKEVAAMLRISASAVYKLAKDGGIGSYRINGGSVRISEEDVEAYLKSRRMPALKTAAERLRRRKG